MLTRLFVLCLAFLALPSLASAQAEPIVSWDVGVFAAGQDPASGGQPIAPAVNYALAAAACGQSKVTPPAVVENPNEVRFDDPANVALDCVIASALVQLAAVPLGNGYRVSVRTRGATSQAAWSVLGNPFGRVGTGPVLPATGVRVRRQAS